MGVETRRAGPSPFGLDCYTGTATGGGEQRHDGDGSCHGSLSNSDASAAARVVLEGVLLVHTHAYCALMKVTVVVLRGNQTSWLGAHVKPYLETCRPL